MTINRRFHMTSYKSGPNRRTLCALLAGATLWTLSFAGGTNAQSLGTTIDAGTIITVRTNEDINVSNGDGRVFPGIVEQDVLNRGGGVAIPQGAQVEMLVKNLSKNQVALDLESITANGQRYAIQSQDSVVSSQQADGLGNNKRTGEFVGGGAALGAIIGAIVGGGKGAAIGGGVGALGGAGTQVLTRGRSVNVPAEALVTFRLQQSLQAGVTDSGVSRNGQHYHPAYGGSSVNSAAYRDGLQAGRLDSDRNQKSLSWNKRYSSGQQLTDYQAGYRNGYSRVSTTSNNDVAAYNNAPAYPAVQRNSYNNQQVDQTICVYDRPNYQGR